ncbi:MAG: hypothetical protein ACRDEA_17140, partial [Microcystaceae cyanobacterium]
LTPMVVKLSRFGWDFSLPFKNQAVILEYYYSFRPTNHSKNHFLGFLFPRLDLLGGVSPPAQRSMSPEAINVPVGHTVREPVACGGSQASALGGFPDL